VPQNLMYVMCSQSNSIKNLRKMKIFTSYTEKKQYCGICFGVSLP